MIADSSKTLRDFLRTSLTGSGISQFFDETANISDIVTFGWHLGERLLKLTPREFEALVGELMKLVGATEVTLARGTQDGGIDVEFKLGIQGASGRVAVQAKRWKNSVGVDKVRELLGVIENGSYDAGVLITTSSFTGGAEYLAKEAAVVLVDRARLVPFLAEKGFGVTREWVARKGGIKKDDIDEAFFANLKNVAGLKLDSNTYKGH